MRKSRYLYFSKILIDRVMKEYYLNDYKNDNPVINVTINERERFAVIELSSVEEANRLLKLGTIELID